MPTSNAGVSLIKEFEGFSANRYDDGTGVQTVGYGTTSADVSPLPLHVTRGEADTILRRALKKKYEPAISALQLGLNSNQFDALVSFAYNLGPAAFTTAPNFETLQRAVKKRDHHAIADALLLYDNPGSSVHAGLKKRRAAERALFLKPVDAFAGYPDDEARWLREYDDLLRQNTDPERRNTLRFVMAQRAHEITQKANPKTRGGDGHGWDYAERRARYHSLKARIT